MELGHQWLTLVVSFKPEDISLLASLKNIVSGWLYIMQLSHINLKSLW